MWVRHCEMARKLVEGKRDIERREKEWVVQRRETKEGEKGRDDISW